MESPVPGLVVQMKGILTKARCSSATVFTDHLSDVAFMHLQKSTNAQETVEAKYAFERWSNSHGVNIKHYHADNGLFTENVFMADVARKGQTISFCGVNAHFPEWKSGATYKVIARFSQIATATSNASMVDCDND
jgi:hypothetical protein